MLWHSLVYCTVFSLLLRHYQPSQGRILLDGVDINSLPLRSLRQQLAVVPQHPVIFSMSIAENIMMACPDASEADLQEALGNLTAQRTTLVAAHRLATVIHASRIAMLDKGRLIAVDNHQELLEVCPLYRQFAQLQRLDAKMESGPEFEKIRA